MPAPALLVVAALGAAILAGCGPGAATVRPASSPAPVVTVACTDGSVRLAVGATLEVTGCPPVAALAVAVGAQVLAPAGGTRVRALAPGSAQVQVTRGLPCSPGRLCSDLRQQLATITVQVHR